jgi:hypothetical protein
VVSKGNMPFLQVITYEKAAVIPSGFLTVPHLCKTIVGLRKYAYNYRGSRNGRGRGGHSIEPKPLFNGGQLVIKRSIEVYR